jgi:NIMA (never in mitosis gene a)-related kinase
MYRHVICWYVLEIYIDGGDLHRLINVTKKDFGKIPELTIWKVAADILGALEHLHSKGILHRDLKSANIFIHGEEYKLGDLNVSKVNGGKLAFTQTGTPYYASP